ncbi:DNA/RNA helicase domain-containing protein [Paenibacillus sedimenti]|uniref:DUF2075 domain-containing protein n=1 Tax=Paenibacillus sedimenti TaxID=2770274 RepID=A0A926KWL6_9BACL|nr:DNA/RNA helicase domain-containing protein [Paenibacillus sedimenti]MBD0384907.1 DUF2075 domain-containing protein [Paenibacillus sedimenti]
MKPINLLSLVQAKKALSPSAFEQYMKAFSIQIKDQEVEGISQIVDELTDHPKRLFMLDAFYVGFTIPQISKEFDLLRIGKESIINIELKKLNTGDRMKKQVLENQYYLGFLEKRIHSFTYVSDECKLFYLNKEEDTYSEVAFNQLLECLKEQEVAPVDDIYSLFNPTNYLVSPSNSTNKFMDGQYFLTDHQKEIKDKILKMDLTSRTNYFSIEGAAGTGKTLLTYSIAKDFKSQGKSVLIVHVGNLNDGQLKLNRKYKWNIIPVKNYEKQDFSKFDVIVFDEIQRISRRQLDTIIDSIGTGSTVIFSYDGEQCLSDWEIENNIPQVIQSLTPHYGYKLTKRIRTNKEIASFISNLFDLKSRNTNQEYRNISVQYFSTAKEAMLYSYWLSEDEWKVINLTPSRYTKIAADSYRNIIFDTAHAVVGQEYDNVVAFLDGTFYHTEEGILNIRGDYYYNPAKMLFQILTRTRKKLHLIILKNEKLLKTSLSILENKPDEKRDSQTSP